MAPHSKGRVGGGRLWVSLPSLPAFQLSWLPLPTCINQPNFRAAFFSFIERVCDGFLQPSFPSDAGFAERATTVFQVCWHRCRIAIPWSLLFFWLGTPLRVNSNFSFPKCLRRVEVRLKQRHFCLLIHLGFMTAPSGRRKATEAV